MEAFSPQRRVFNKGGVLKRQTCPHYHINILSFYVKIYHVQIKAIPMKLQNFLNCGASANAPVSGPHEPLAVSYTVLDIQLSTASGRSAGTLNASLQEWLKPIFTELSEGHK